MFHSPRKLKMIWQADSGIDPQIVTAAYTILAVGVSYLNSKLSVGFLATSKEMDSFAH